MKLVDAEGGEITIEACPRCNNPDLYFAGFHAMTKCYCDKCKWEEWHWND